MYQIDEAMALVMEAIEAGKTDGIEYLFNCNLRARADGEALLAAVQTNALAETNWGKLWRASLHAFLGQSDGMRRALRGAEGALAEKFRALFGYAEWYGDWHTRETARFVWRFPGDEPEAFIRAREAAYDALQAFFGFALDQRVRMFIWPSRTEARERLGRGLGFAIPQYWLIHSACDQSPGHELAHLFTHYLSGAREKTAFVTEGAAVALDQTGRDNAKEAREAMAALGMRTVDVAGLWRDFHKAHFSVSYPVAGLFCARFLAAHGRASFIELLRHQEYEDTRAHFGAGLIDFLVKDVQNLTNR